MAASGYPVQIVQVTEDHRFVMDERNLDSVLLREDIKNLPVVLVSVAGAYRKGKSFLLNFFLRYLSAPQSNREDGSWLFQSDTLEGFSWRSGTERNTTGILIWSKPFIFNITPEKKVAVLLMDTQGTFDSSSTVTDCSNIFALSTLICSVQLYNLMQDIQEDQLQHLHLFTEYGRTVRRQFDGKAFQNLIFLIRDWSNWSEFPYGTAGGNQFLERKLQVTPTMAPEIQDVRRHIRSCFEKVSCFLMPHPGLDVTEDPNYRGAMNVITERFKTYVKELATSIFLPRNLAPKVISGREVTAEALSTYFKSYMGIFSSGRMPPTSSIAQVTTAAGLLTAIREMAAQYDANMERECGEHTPCVPLVDVKELHERYKKSALDNYRARNLMGSREIIEQYRVKLSDDIKERLKKYTSVNAVKRQAVIEAAKKAYADKVKEYSQNDDEICVHPDDLETINISASRIALATFDSLVKRITNKRDEERDNFIRTLTNELNLLKRSNDRHNDRLVTDLRLMYWDQMQPSITAVPPIFPAQLQRNHTAVFQRVLTKFREDRKCLADSYATDVYKDRLQQAINNSYEEIKTMNSSVNGRSMNAAVGEYRDCINREWNQRTQHLHPDELEQIHRAARSAAWATMFGNGRLEQDLSDEDRDSLDRMIDTRYDEYKQTNATLNREAIQAAYNLFLSSLEEQQRARWYWIFIVPIVITALATLLGECFRIAKAAAIPEFYKNRKNKGLESTDVYYQEFIEKINQHNPMWLLERGLQFFRNFIRDHYGIDI